MAVRWLASLLLVATTWALACGSSAVGVDACRQIEETRCQRAPGCGISLEPPYETAGGDVSACMRFYDEACLHGLAIGTNPSPVDQSQCLAALRTGACSVVVHPESSPACAWLTPLVTVDASDDADGQ